MHINADVVSRSPPVCCHEPSALWTNASSRWIARSRPPTASVSRATSCGTIQVYVALLPCAKPVWVDGVKPEPQLPSALRACWWPPSPPRHDW
jgi:hypothetical protein